MQFTTILSYFSFAYTLYVWLVQRRLYVAFWQKSSSRTSLMQKCLPDSFSAAKMAIESTRLNKDLQKTCIFAQPY